MNNKTSMEIFKPWESHDHKTLYVRRQQDEIAVHDDYLDEITVRRPKEERVAQTQHMKHKTMNTNLQIGRAEFQDQPSIGPPCKNIMDLRQPR